MMKKIQEESLRKLNSVKFIQIFLKFKFHWIKVKKSKLIKKSINRQSPSKNQTNEIKSQLNNYVNEIDNHLDHINNSQNYETFNPKSVHNSPSQLAINLNNNGIHNTNENKENMNS